MKYVLIVLFVLVPHIVKADFIGFQSGWDKFIRLFDHAYHGNDNSYYDDYVPPDDNCPAPIPEPTTVILMSIGIASVALLKKRKKETPCAH